jgi:hypothetical protein
MPIPKPNPNEDKEKFVSRCMSNDTMKQEYSDSKQRVAVCLGQTKAEENCLLSEVQDAILSSQEYDEEWDEFIYDIEAFHIYDEDEKLIAAEKNGRKVTLNKPFRTPDGPKKFSVYVKNGSGNVVKVNFGDPNMEIKKDIPARRKSFRARMRCDTPGPKWKSRYWACKSW